MPAAQDFQESARSLALRDHAVRCGGTGVVRVGHLDLRAQAEPRSARRPTHRRCLVLVDGTGARIPAWLPVGDPERPRPSIEDLALPDPTGENEGRG
jgi:hypothetical protein